MMSSRRPNTNREKSIIEMIMQSSLVVAIIFLVMASSSSSSSSTHVSAFVGVEPVSRRTTHSTIILQPPASWIYTTTTTTTTNTQKHIKTVLNLSLDNNNNNNNNNNAGGLPNMDPGLKLLICILIDLIGISSFVAPGVGEATDAAWAPISALLVNYLFGNGIFTTLAFVEEFLPGFDIIPTATIAWFVENGNRPPEERLGGPPPPPPPPPPPSNPSPSPPPQGRKRPDVSDAIDVEIID